MKMEFDSMIDLREPLSRFVRRRVSDPHDADDIVQDVLLKALANRESIPPDERLAAWMFRTARNAIIDRYRTRKPDGLEYDLADARDEEPKVVGELASCLRCMLERLDEPYRDALKLAEMNGLSQQQVADRMGISLSGAKSRVQRARQQLQTIFAACCSVQRDVRGNVTDFYPTNPARENCLEQHCDCDD
jgi:RNA polymerase sigma-70 factor (ECF subfamily)